MTPLCGEEITSTNPKSKRLFVCVSLLFVFCCCVSPRPTRYIFHTRMAWFSPFVLKVPLHIHKTDRTNEIYSVIIIECWTKVKTECGEEISQECNYSSSSAGPVWWLNYYNKWWTYQVPFCAVYHTQSLLFSWPFLPNFGDCWNNSFHRWSPGALSDTEPGVSVTEGTFTLH